MIQTADASQLLQTQTPFIIFTFITFIAVLVIVTKLFQSERAESEFVSLLNHKTSEETTLSLMVKM